MTQFDPATFLSEPVQGGFSTRITPVPEGDFPAIVTKYEARQMPNDKDASKPYTVVDVTFEIDDARAREVTGMEKPTSRMSVFLDLTSEGKLDRSKGKNVQLGRLLEGLGLNSEDAQFSWNDLPGKPCIVHIDHTPSKKNAEDMFANVTKVGKL